MGPLYQDDCRAVLSAVETIYRAESMDQFPAAVFSAVRKILSCNTICFNEVTLPDSMTVWVTEPADAVPGLILRDAFMRNFTEHPVLAHYARTGDSTVYRISDFLSPHQFHGLNLYNEYYRKSSVEYQLAATLMIGPGRLVGIALDRHCKDFSEEERLRLDLLRPHLARVYHNLQTLEIMKHVIEVGGKKLVIVDRSGRLRLAGDDAWRIITRFFGVSRFQERLPEMLDNWINHERSRLNDDSDVPSPSVPLSVNKNGRRLTVHFVWGGKRAGQDMLLFEEEISAVNVESGSNAELTRREAEILAWLAQGRTNEEIGLALSISPLTVKKHLEHIYSKLGIHGRAAAVARSFQLYKIVGVVDSVTVPLSLAPRRYP
jgi:DNA-binding CsgD family transcriptional regulator